MRYARLLTLYGLAGLLVHSAPLLAADSAAGRALYQQYCSVCHGAQGKGDGPAASTMQPKPRNHTDGQYMNSLSEAHLTRVISEGGAAVQRSPLMPSWKGTLDRAGDLVALVTHPATRPRSHCGPLSVGSFCAGQAALDGAGSGGYMCSPGSRALSPSWGASSTPKADYRWIEVGRDLGQAQGVPLSQVQRFWEKPSRPQAQLLLCQWALWNTLLLVGSFELLVTLFTVLTRPLADAFIRVRRMLGTPHEAGALAEVYTNLVQINFSQTILTGSVPRLAVLPMTGVCWSDWGDPQRLVHDLVHWGHPPPTSLQPRIVR